MLNFIKRKLIKDYDLKILIRGGLKVGKNFFHGGSYIDPGFPFLIEIGDNVTITNSALLAHDASTKLICGKSRVGKIKIGNNVFIGYGSIVLPNVHIGDNVVIGAGSIVTKDIPSNSLAVGSPCRVVDTYEAYKTRTLSAMETHPIYPTYHAYKSQEEINKMIEELDSTWGYDE